MKEQKQCKYLNEIIFFYFEINTNLWQFSANYFTWIILRIGYQQKSRGSKFFPLSPKSIQKFAKFDSRKN